MSSERSEFRSAEDVLLSVLPRAAARMTAESSIERFHLPRNDLKGALIGRDGRCIRTFEQVTQVDLIIDETPEIVFLASHDPRRRLAASLTLSNLLFESRITPEDISRWHAESLRSLADATLDRARSAVSLELPEAVLRQLGELSFLKENGQNLLDRSLHAVDIARLIALELHLLSQPVERAALLHDIGKTLPDLRKSHSEAGADFLQRHGFSEDVTEPIRRQNDAAPPKTPVDSILRAAKSAAASTRRDTGHSRLAALEKLAESFEGVEAAYVVDSGRELRALVKSSAISESEAGPLARSIAQAIQKRFEYSGSLRVAVIRESQTVERVF